LAYKIPVSQKAKLSPSIIFDYDKPIAIIGDFHKGRKKLFLFLSELLKMNILNNEELKKQIHNSETCLYNAGIMPDMKTNTSYLNVGKFMICVPKTGSV